MRESEIGNAISVTSRVLGVMGVRTLRLIPLPMVITFNHARREREQRRRNRATRMVISIWSWRRRSRSERLALPWSARRSRPRSVDRTRRTTSLSTFERKDPTSFSRNAEVPTTPKLDESLSRRWLALSDPLRLLPGEIKRKVLSFKLGQSLSTRSLLLP